MILMIDIKGPGFWKMNCSLLDDEDYVNDISEKIPIWLAEGFEELLDSRSIWLKYNIRAHTIQYSKRRARERKEGEQNLQEEYDEAKFIFETDPKNRNVSTSLYGPLNSKVFFLRHNKYLESSKRYL